MRIRRAFTASRLATILLSLLIASTGHAQQDFETPEQAVAALSDLIGAQEAAEEQAADAIERLFGEGSAELFDSGDRAMDIEDYRRIKAMIEEKLEFSDHDDRTKVALFGADAWPWPIPLVKESGMWRFDTASGREELINRRIGRNELHTLAALREIVAAQREYALVGRDGRPPAYARKFRSAVGKRDGLYWPSVEGEPLSPLGDLLADSDVTESEPRPFHGYFYRILTAQGGSAPGGERDYLDDEGNLRGGFAVVAWPAKHGSSGVMTFLMSQRGIIYQRDLGEGTAEQAGRIQVFDPDAAWMPTGDAGNLVVE